MKTKRQAERSYSFSFEDRAGNELESKIKTARDIKEARHMAALEFAETRMNDLYKIRVRRIY